MRQWRRFISQFTGGVKDDTDEWHGGSSVVMVEGNPAKRDKLYAQAIAERPRYTIISYDQVVNDYELVKELPWDFAVGDEVTLIKSFDSARSGALKTIRPEFIYGLTGDPVENSADELFSIMQWIDPTVLGRDDLFDDYFVVRAKKGFVVGYKHLDELHEIMNESKAWVLKKADDPDVAAFMPKKLTPIVHYVDLDRPTAELYEEVAAELLEDLAEMARQGAGHIDVAAMYAGSKGAKSAHGKAAAKLMALRLLCAHPYALQMSAHRFLSAPERPAKWTTIRLPDGSTKRVLKAPPKPGSKYAAHLAESGAIERYLGATPKLDAAVGIVDSFLAANPKNKMVVFSTLKDVLVALDLMYEGEGVIHNGDMSSKAKDAAKRQFQMDPDTRLFLSSDSGAYGVDLPQANAVFNYDSPFSAGATRQRNARAHRGSSLEYWSHTQVINLLVRGSVEEFYYAKTQRKIELGDAIKSGKRSGEIRMSAESLTEFLLASEV